MRKGKFILILGVILLGIIAYFINHNISRTVDINGEILLNCCYDENGCIVIYDCEKKEYTELPLKGSQAAFGSNNTVFVKDMNIYKYDIDADEMSVVYASEDLIDYFTVIGEDKLSIAKDNLIFLYDINSKNEIVLVEDNGSDVHSWIDERTVLYSDSNNKIKSLHIDTGEVEVLCEGIDPISYGSKIAYKTKGKLTIRDNSGHVYEYNGSAYDHIFAENGEILLVEDEMTLGTGIKNLFSNGIIFGHRIVAWDYQTNSTKTIIDFVYPTFNSLGDWR